MDNQIKWAQFISGVYGPPPTTQSGRRLFEQREKLPEAYARFGRDVTKLNSRAAKYLAGGDKTWERPIADGLSAIETMIPMGGTFLLGANALNHYEDNKCGRLVIDGFGTKPGRAAAGRAALMSIMMSHKATRPFVRCLKKYM